MDNLSESEESNTSEIKNLKSNFNLTAKSVSVSKEISKIKNNEKDLLTKRISVDFNKINSHHNPQFNYNISPKKNIAKIISKESSNLRGVKKMSQ